MDDLVIITENENIIKGIERDLKNQFKMTDAGPLSYILGRNCIQTKDRLKINQSTTICLYSGKHATVSASTVPVEYVLLANATKEDIFLK